MAQTDVLTAVSTLGSLDESALYGELGLRLKAIAKQPQLSSEFALRVGPETKEQLGVREDLAAFGKRFFDRVSAQAYGFVCGSDANDLQQREKLAEAVGLGKESFAVGLAALLIAELGMAPAIATVVALLLVRLFFRPALDSMCDVWRTKLPPEHSNKP